MLPKYLIALFLADVSASPAPAPAAEVAAGSEAHLQKRAWWYATQNDKPKEECRVNWSGICYEHCVTSARGRGSACVNSVKSSIVKAECLPFQSRCKCEC